MVTLGKADLILVNGQFHTVDRENPVAEAVAVRDGKFLEVGTVAEVMQHHCEGTKVVDLKGHTAIPGLNDSHLDLIRGGLNYNLELRWEGVPSLADALRMLTELQGRRHTVCTGVTVRQGDRILTESEETGVFFRPASEAELRAYIATGEPMDKAGAYGVQGQGALLVERIDGDFFNVMGLPVLLLSRMLAEFGITLLG